MTNMSNLPYAIPVYTASVDLPASTYAGAEAIVLTPSIGIYLFDGSAWGLAAGGGTSLVNSVTGASLNQVLADPTSGAVSLSLSSTLIAPGSVTSTTVLSSLIGSTADGTFSSPSLVLGTNTSYSGQIQFLSRTSGASADIFITNGDFHIVPFTTNTTYLNYYRGTGGTSFGSGTSTTVARVDNTGSAVFGSGTIIASAVLTCSSTTKGFLPPVLTTVQRDAISAPVTGLVIYNITTGDLEAYNGASWVGASGSGVTSIAGTTNQINASASTGSVTLSLSSTLAVPGTMDVTGSSQFLFGSNVSGTAVVPNAIFGKSDGTSTGALKLWAVTPTNFGTIQCTDGNIHIDAHTNKGVWLNFYRGTDGIIFGSGLSSIVGRVDGSGSLALGTASSPSYRLDVSGQSRLSGSVGINAGPVNWTALTITGNGGPGSAVGPNQGILLNGDLANNFVPDTFGFSASCSFNQTLTGDVSAFRSAFSIGGTFQNVFHFKVNSPGVTGSMVSQWGLYIPSLTGATNNYGAYFGTNVGIMTDTPLSTANIESTSSTASRQNFFASFYGTSTATHGFYHCRQARGTRASPTQSVSGDILGGISATGYYSDTGFATPIPTGRFYFYSLASFTSSSHENAALITLKRSTTEDILTPFVVKSDSSFQLGDVALGPTASRSAIYALTIAAASNTATMTNFPTTLSANPSAFWRLLFNGNNAIIPIWYE